MRIAALLVLFGLLLVTGPVAVAREQGGDCPIEFGPDMLDLRAAIGEVMGQPTGCETAVDAIGDTMQPTSTGMAWYAPGSAATIFTDGFQRWELDVRGLTYWRAPDAVPVVMDGLPEGPATWSRSVVCPVLYTHEVPPRPTFRQFVIGLLQAGFQPISFAEVDAALAAQRDVPRDCIVLSFDDGLASQLRNAVPVLAELQITGIFFVMPAFQDGRHQYLDAAGISALHQAGHMIGAHTCNHPSLTLLSLTMLNAELDCRRQIENVIGVPVRYLAYPNGAVNQTVLGAVAQSGYRAAFTTRAAGLLRADQPLLLPRIRYDASESVATVIRRIRSAG